VKGEGNQQDYGLRVYDPRLGRFFSVDPLTNGYPMLTPYQFASNRPIDSVDRDGLEWTYNKTYDPKTGGTNIQFHVKLKLINRSEILKNENDMMKFASKQFSEAFKDIGDSKTTYSGTLNISLGTKEPNDFSATLIDDADQAIGGTSIFVNPKSNNSEINVYDSRKGVAASTPRAAENVAQDIVHELIHTAGPNHPDGANQAEDIQLIRNDRIAVDGTLVIDHMLSPSAILAKVIHNIMVYSNTKING